MIKIKDKHTHWVTMSSRHNDGFTGTGVVDPKHMLMNWPNNSSVTTVSWIINVRIK